jgi:glycosyltransferase involved in cell wall biosynthesis
VDGASRAAAHAARSASSPEAAAGRAEQLMVLPVPLRLLDGKILFEQQACNGIARWGDHFDSLIVAAPTIPESLVGRFPTLAWLDVEGIEHRPRVTFVPLPWAYAWRDHLRHARPTRRLLRELIERSDYLHFGIGAWLGDWGAEGAHIARRLGRPYAVHMDRVEDEHLIRKSADKPLLQRLKVRFRARYMQGWRRRLIADAALSMCHGHDTFQAYHRLNPHSFVVHNVHVTAEDQATPSQIAAKLQRLKSGKSLKIIYAGRLDADKAPLDWVRAIRRAVERGADLTAAWIGEGALRPMVEAEIRRLGLSDRISLPGFTSDRSAVLSAIRDADLLLFTHVTPESPRVLIEALVCATPIIGYQSHYPAELIRNHQAGVLTPMGAPIALGDALADLSKDRARLARLIEAAAVEGRQFTAAAVFEHRSKLIRKYLAPGPRPRPAEVVPMEPSVS